jgi:hypothetical protein
MRGANGVASKVMSDHQKHTEFLRDCIRYDEGARRQELMAEIIRIQCDARCVLRAVWLMAMVAALAVFGLGYGTILGDNFPYNMPPFIVNLFWALGLGALISLVAFMGLGIVFRWKLDRRREECRQIVKRLLESRLGKTATAPLRDGPVSNGSLGPARVAAGVDGAPVTIESTDRG